MSSLTKFVVAVAALYAPLAAADSPPTYPSITSVKYSGDGCPQSGPGVAKSGPFNDPTFKFDNFAANSPGVENRTVACEVHVSSSGGSPGWQYALSSNTIKAHLTLAAGATLNYYTTVYFSQDATNTQSRSDWIRNTDTGKIDGPVTLQQNPGLVWSSCTGDASILNVNFRGALNGYADFEVDSENWDFVWRRC